MARDVPLASRAYLCAELWEIDENLMRAELTPAQQADHLKRRKEVWEALNSAQTLREKAGRPEGFAADTERRTGTPRRTTQLHVARAEALGPDIREVVGTSLDKGVELDALAKMAPAERHAAATPRLRRPLRARVLLTKVPRAAGMTRAKNLSVT